MPSFSDLGVPAVLVKTLDKLGIDTPTPIQAATLPDSLAGRDVLGRGRTGKRQQRRRKDKGVRGHGRLLGNGELGKATGVSGTSIPGRC